MRNRILFIVQLPPPVHGASMVNEIIVNSKLVNSAYETRVLPLKFVSNVEEIGKFSLRKVGLMLIFIFRLLQQLIQFRPHLVYYTNSPKGGSFYRDAFFGMILKAFGKKIVFHLHSRGLQQSKFSGKMKQFINKIVFRNTFVISLSESLLGEFKNIKVKEILFLPNGIPDYKYDITKRAQQVPEVLFLSNLFMAKGIFVFLEAVEKLKSISCVFKAKIIGMDGDITAQELQSLIEQKGLKNDIDFLGAMYGAEKHQALAAASVFVMPSLNEAFPLTILEAMQASLPVVASRVGAIPEMVQDGKNGYLCPPGNADAFAKSISRLLHDASLRQKMSAESLLHFETNFTQAQFERNLKSIIDRLINRQ